MRERTRQGAAAARPNPPSSKYYGQSDEGALFPVVITSPHGYAVTGGPGGQYRLSDVDLFAVFSGAEQPIQITFEPTATP